jgi:peptidyl-prolyl cis-trans isomerase SurA
MKIKTILAALLLGATAVQAQTQNDPVIMTINGQPVTRSEFEYSYNKNNTDGVIDKKSIDEYVDLFVNYKLKVQAALDAQLDTLSSFRKEFATYRDQQIRPSLVTDADVEKEARDYYDNLVKQIGPKGLFTCSHILILASPDAEEAVREAAKNRIDSVYTVITNGADFAEVAKNVSQDPGSAKNGGRLPLATKGYFFKEFEDAALALKDGEISKPILSPVGYHIIRMEGRQDVEPYDTLGPRIVRYLESRGVRDKIVDEKIAAEVAASNGALTAETYMDQLSAEKEAQDPELKNLIREYHDGLLLFEVCNREVWEKAAQDEAGLAQYFKQNKKKYKWDAPRFKGISYHVKDAKDVAAVRNCVKKLPFDQWTEKLRTEFNNDSIIRIRVKKGIFKEGDDALVDNKIFKKDTTVTEMKDYPFSATYGKKLKAPEDYTDVRGLVTADYQELLEKAWVDELRKKYTVVVNKDVLATVNKYD